MKTVAGSTGQQKLGSGNWAYRRLDIAGRDRDGGFSLGVLVLGFGFVAAGTHRS